MLDAATIEVLDDQDNVVSTGIVIGRTPKALHAKARKYVRMVSAITGIEYSSYTIESNEGQDLAETR